MKIFPFCPGIPWEVSGNVIRKKLDGESWNKLLNENNPIITCFGGLFESYLSLSFIEALNKIYPTKKVTFNDNEKFNSLILLNALSTINNSISEELLKKYPIPLFIDSEKNVYFNSLYNYINIFNYSGEFVYKNYSPISKQLFSNSCLDWNINYTPQFRKLEQPIEFSKWKDSKKFNIDKPFVLIFPDKTDLSMHSISMLGWPLNQVKSFVSMISGSGMNSVIITKNTGRYTGINSLVIEPKIEYILCLIEKCSVILSEEIDFLLIALLHSKNAIAFGRENKQEYSLKYNQKFLQTNKKIIEAKTLNPFDIYKAIK